MAQRHNANVTKKKSFLNFFQPDPERQNMSLREQWHYDIEKNKKDGSNLHFVKVFIWSLMCFHGPTKTYAFLCYITPFLIGDYGPWVVYFFNVAVCFVFMNHFANWFCTILYDPSYPKTRDNPFLDIRNEPRDQFVPMIEQAGNNQNGLNGQCVYDMMSKEGLPWEYCDKCEMHIPPRAHHCKYCKKCILKRDHHCFLVGNCIGFKNQRYFIMYNFYTAISGWVGGFFTFRYITLAIWPELNSWIELFFPIAIWNCFFGNVKGIHALLLFHIVLEILFGFLSFVYFSSQMTMSAQGKTLFEVVKKVPIKNNNSLNKNMRSVFGDYWALNFLFPMTIIFRQRDDGIHWDNVKIDHNLNNKKCFGNDSDHV